jgi:hypothetical protein
MMDLVNALPSTHKKHLYLVVPSTHHGVGPVVWNKVQFRDTSVTQKEDRIPQTTFITPTAKSELSSELTDGPSDEDDQIDSESSHSSSQISNTVDDTRLSKKRPVDDSVPSDAIDPDYDPRPSKKRSVGDPFLPNLKQFVMFVDLNPSPPNSPKPSRNDQDDD